MLIVDSFKNTRIICLNGAELNGDCISDSFFSVQFFMTLGIMVFFFCTPSNIINSIYCILCKNVQKR